MFLVEGYLNRYSHFYYPRSNRAIAQRDPISNRHEKTAGVASGGF